MWRQLCALEPVRAGNQPMGAAVTFPLQHVNRDKQLQVGQCGIQGGAFRSGHNGVAVVDEQRADLAVSGVRISPGSSAIEWQPRWPGGRATRDTCGSGSYAGRCGSV